MLAILLLKQLQHLFLPIFYVKLQKKTKQEAEWSAVIQATILLGTIYTRVTLRNHNRSTALEQSVKDNWDGEGGELTLVLSDPKPRPHLLNNFQTHYIFWASIDVNDLNFPRSAMGHIKR